MRPAWFPCMNTAPHGAHQHTEGPDNYYYLCRGIQSRIPDEAVRAAIVAAGNTLLHGDRGAQMRAALEAALPHLEGATPTCSGCSVDPSPEQGIPDRFIADGDCPVHGEGATPAIDRGALGEEIIAEIDRCADVLVTEGDESGNYLVAAVLQKASDIVRVVCGLPKRGEPS